MPINSIMSVYVPPEKVAKCLTRFARVLERLYELHLKAGQLDRIARCAFNSSCKQVYADAALRVRHRIEQLRLPCIDRLGDAVLQAPGLWGNANDPTDATILGRFFEGWPVDDLDEIVLVQERVNRLLGAAFSSRQQEGAPVHTQIARAPVIDTELQVNILAALDGRALGPKNLTREVRAENTLYKPGGINELLADGRVVRVPHTPGGKRARLYFRPDRPPTQATAA